MNQNRALKKALEHILDKDHASARKLLVRVLRKDPKNESAWYLLSQALEEREKQVYALQQALRINPENGRVRARLEKLRAMDSEGKVQASIPEPAPPPAPPAPPKYPSAAQEFEEEMEKPRSRWRSCCLSCSLIFLLVVIVGGATLYFGGRALVEDQMAYLEEILGDYLLLEMGTQAPGIPVEPTKDPGFRPLPPTWTSTPSIPSTSTSSPTLEPTETATPTPQPLFVTITPTGTEATGE